MADVTRRLAQKEARKLLSEILASGVLHFSNHARKEMAVDNLTQNDVLNVLAGGHITEPGELVNGSWRYRVRTDQIGVVVAFADSGRVAVVTAWRTRR